MTASDTANTSSTHSLKTEKSFHDTFEHTVPTFVPGHEESAMPEDKEFPEIVEDNWENDPENARNWPAYKKWVSVSIVR